MLKVNDYVKAKGYIGDKWVNGEIKRIRVGNVGKVTKLGKRGIFPTVYVTWGTGELQNQELEVMENGLTRISQDDFFLSMIIVLNLMC